MRGIVLGLMAVAACGSSPGGGGGGGADGGTLDFFPLAVGNTWTYRVTDLATSATKSKSSTVEDFEIVGGGKSVMAYRIRTDKMTGETVSWQRVNGEVLERHREQSFDAGAMSTDELYEPYKLRLDETAARTALNASWQNTYTEEITDYTAGGLQSTNSKTDTWTVVATDASVTVPAGTFTCLELRKVTAGSGVTKTYWFADGVGKVKEEGGGSREELDSFELR